QHHSLIPLLRQSPPPSTSLSLPLQLLHKNFPQYPKHSQPKINKIIPSYGQSLIHDVQLITKIPKQTSKHLQLRFYNKPK
ncbi:malate:quinone oxidoreductase, partial [Staphylococcus epidermidis]|uniref:malate:quinone oxidoreductase n=1 Tax=Staphylococcus epidermidis TaxID=1282 RepID=UPI001642ADAA